MIDAVKFIEERTRMCNNFNSLECKGCPAFNAYELSCAVGQESTMSATDQITTVEKWSSEHPRKTRQDLFLEMYPTALLTEGGILSACPVLLSSEYRDKSGRCTRHYTSCVECRKEFWSQEVE